MATTLPLVDNLSIYEGDDSLLSFTTRLTDITGYSVSFQVRETVDSRYAVINVAGVVTDAEHYSVTIPSATSLGRGQVRPYFYGIQLTSPGGKVYTDRHGTFLIEPRTTDLNPPPTGGVTPAYSPTLATHFVGIYTDLQALKDAVTHPTQNLQAIILNPSEKYYHYVGTEWLDLAPVGSFHSKYLGAYDSVTNLQLANPTPEKDALAIVGTVPYTFYFYDGSSWNEVQHTDIPKLDARLTTVENKTHTLDSAVGALGADVRQLQSSQFKGMHIEDVSGNAFDAIDGLVFDGATVDNNGSSTTAHINIKPKFTVANGQEGGSTSFTGNALIFEGATIEQSQQDSNVIKVTTVGHSNTPAFDASMFQSAVDHGYAADDQGIKSSTTTDGWWVFKDLKSVSGRPADAVGDLVVFRNTLVHDNPALKHAFVMAIGKNAKLQNKVWFMYRDGVDWTPWFSEQGAQQSTIDNLATNVDELKRANQAVLNELAQLQTAAGNLYAPDKTTFDKAVNALIQAALKNYQPISPSHGGDKPDTEYPRIYVQFSNNIPTDLTGAVTSINAEATLVGNPVTPSRIFISVENDNDEASKVVGFKFNNRQEMTLQHRDIVIGGKKYRAFYTAGAFSESGIEVKVDFGQGI